MSPISELIQQNKSPEDIINLITKGDHELVDEMPLKYHCDCSKERFFDGLKTLSKEDLDSLTEDDSKVEIVCEFCKTKYEFSSEEIKNIAKK
jgi:molecular chaperone Hsp33